MIEILIEFALESARNLNNWGLRDELEYEDPDTILPPPMQQKTEGEYQ